MSCERTRAVLDDKQVTIGEERNARKNPMTDDEARQLLGSVARVTVAKGRSARTLPASEAGLDDLRGPTGNFRAPMIRRGRVLLVGFSDEELRRLLG